MIAEIHLFEFSVALLPEMQDFVLQVKAEPASALLRDMRCDS